MAKFVCENCGRTFKHGGRVIMPRNGIPRYFCCIQCEREGLGDNLLASFIGETIGGFLKGYLGSNDDDDDD
ncbi:MAG: hypothetical protein LBH43_05765 [Treponema sp.]|nr:hypothetical protein [Treponema sp.]